MESIEWKDPKTGEIHRCPQRYIEMYKYLGKGVKNAITANALLHKMNEPRTEVNQRHLRQAAMLLRKQGIFVLSLRSSKGGYFIAQTEQEISEYAASQRTPAESMLANAEEIEELWKAANRGNL